jgi:hypothetical protein
MYELYAMTAGEALILLLVLAAHGTLIGFLVRRGWLAVPRPTSAPMSVTSRTGKPAAPEPQERMAA